MTDDEYIELNLNNYDHEDVCQLNSWAVWAYGRIEELERVTNRKGHGLRRHVHLGPDRACGRCGKDPTDVVHFRITEVTNGR